MGDNCERSFIMVKPDGVHRGVVGEIIKRFEQRGYRLVAMKFVWVTPELLKQHYEALSAKPFFNDLVKYMNSGPVVPMADKELLKKHYDELKERPFFPKLMDYMSSGPVVPMVWEGKKIVEVGRQMLGATDPLKSNPGTIRGDFAIDVGRNICHGSDSVESACREIKLWFTEQEMIAWTPASKDWIYE